MSPTSAVASKADLKAAMTPTMTLPSGIVVQIKIPNLVALAKGGAIPNRLLKFAVPELRASEENTGEPLPEEKALENINLLADFQAWVVSTMLVKPNLSAEDVHEALSTPDIEMLVELGLRQRDMDAVGHHIGGLEVLDTFRQFRGLDSSQSDLLGL